MPHTMHYKGFTLDDFQRQAIEAIENNHSVVVSAPTGSGKTLIADYIVDRDVRKGYKVVYTAPIKALSNQKYKEFCREYGEDKVGLLTGDQVINPQGMVLIMTTEIYRNMVLVKDDLVQDISYVIFDEIHYINDVERGYVWEESIIFSPPKVRFLCLSATIPNAQEFADWIHAIKRHKVEVITHHHRIVPLEHLFFEAVLGVTTLAAIEETMHIPDYNKAMHMSQRRQKYGHSPGRAMKEEKPLHIELVKELAEKNELPCLFFNFGRQACQNKAVELARKNLFEHNARVTQIVQDRLHSAAKEIGTLPTTRILRETLPKGVGFHHAGLLPILKDIVEELFEKGLLKVLYTTETFAVGLNMPAKTVCFESLRKFDGLRFRFLNTKEYFQMAGRAGRRGIDPKGTVISIITRNEQDLQKAKVITAKDVLPIRSQFKIGINTVLNMILRHNDKEIGEILCKSFYTYQRYKDQWSSRKSVMHHAFDNIVHKMTKLGYVRQAEREYSHAHGRSYELTPKGLFASQIFVDEILFTELFATDFADGLDEEQLLLLFAAIVYEGRDGKDRSKFEKFWPGEKSRELMHRIKSHHVLQREDRLKAIEKMTAFIHPIYHHGSFFDVLKNTNVPEGDLIRFFSQLVDRITQVRKAAASSPSTSSTFDLTQRLDNTVYIVKNVLKEVAVE